MTNEEFQRIVLQKLEKLDGLEESQRNLQESKNDLSIKVEKMNKKLDNLDQSQKTSNIKVESIDKKLDSVVEQTPDLTEFKNQVRAELQDIKMSVSKIEIITADNWGDIARLKAAK